MKNYFKFNLTGRELLPVWLLFLVFYIVPYTLLMYKIKNIQPGDSSVILVLPLMLLILIMYFVFTFYFAKLTLENLVYKEKTIVFNGKFWRFFGTMLLGLFLSVITLGIYLAWFIRDIQRFFVDNTAYNLNNLKFLGKGGRLFVILLLTFMIPVLILSIIMAKNIINNPDYARSSTLITQVVIMLLMIPYMYLLYKWMVNISYRGYTISWRTNFWSSCGKIAIEIVLTVITVGIYMPLAMVRLSKYFLDRTIATDGVINQKFGYDIDQLNDFLFIWGQILLTIITLGIYFPWAYCKINGRILSKTYLEIV